MGLFEIILICVCVILIALLLFIGLGSRADQSVGQSVKNFTEVAERLSQAQAELSGRFQQNQSTVSERLEILSRRLGDSLAQQTEKTGKTLSELHERLAVIDSAQQKITNLSQQVVGLQDILSNKQARGAFGEIQLNDLVTSILPPSAYRFQAKLSNGMRADCLLSLPNPPGPIVIDSKFPLESYQAFCQADNDQSKQKALRNLAAAINKHVQDISEKYIVPGETAESALMFLPSEAVYAELHARLVEVVERSYMAKVWIVSPTTLMATLNTVRAVLKDANMREQADVIQSEVFKLIGDIGRLDDRVGKLQRHMGQANDDLSQIRISTEKVTKRGDRITEIEMGDDSRIDKTSDQTIKPLRGDE